LSAEGLICAAQHAVDEYHKIEHGTGNGMMYSHAMLVVATFSDALIYEYEGKLYRIGYALDGTEVMLDEDPEEVIAEFVPVEGSEGLSEAALAEVIRKTGETWVLRSKDGTKVLGKFKSRKGAERRERQIQAFKHMKEAGEPESVNLAEVFDDLVAIRQGKVKLEFVPGLLQEADAKGSIDALVKWAGGEGFRGCVKHLTGKEGISDVPRLCGWLKARAREAGYLKESQEFQEGTLLREVQATGILREAKLNKTGRVIENTVLITAESANGPHGKRRYSDVALKQIAQMAEGLPAYVNHVEKDQAFRPRDVKDLIGRHRNVRYEPTRHRIVSDLHVLEHQAPWVFSLAEDLPDVVGNSLVSRGLVRMDGDTEVVEEVVALRSVDLVSDPGATKGLFEHREAWRHRAAPIPPGKGGGDDMELKEVQEYLKKADEAVRGVLMETLAGPQLKESAGKIKELQEANLALTTKAGEQEKIVVELKAKVSGFEAAEAQRQKAGRLDKALSESDLGKKYKASPLAISEEFREILLGTDETKWTKLIEDRVKMLDAATATGPRSDGKIIQEGTVPADAHAQMLQALR